MSIHDLIHFEGNVPHLYKDSKGIVTAGVGFALRSLTEAQSLEWDRPGQVRLDWLAIDSDTQGWTPKQFAKTPASYYRRITSARLLNVERELARRTSRLLPTWALTLPEPARDALLDLAYNTGSLRGWPKLCAACQAGDWKRAADESNRPDVGHDRNAWTAERFLACLA